MYSNRKRKLFSIYLEFRAFVSQFFWGGFDLSKEGGFSPVAPLGCTPALSPDLKYI